MKTTHSFGTDFLIRRCKEDRTKALIYVRITVDTERKEISLKHRIQAEHWDSKRETVKGKSIEARIINEHINEVRFKIKSKYLLLQEKGELITGETVKQAYLGEHSMQKGHKLIELLDYYKKIWEPKLKEGGFKNYKTTIDYIKRFLLSQYASGDLYLSQLNMQTAIEFEYFVRNSPSKKHDPCLGNGLAKHVQRFKRIINWAVEIEWIKANPCEKYSCPLKRSKRKKLTIEELVRLENKSFADPVLTYIKELFLFSCYTSFAFADVMALKKSDFEWDTDGTVWCKIYRTKSDILSAVPLLESASRILNKYCNNIESEGDFKIFKPLTNQHVNTSLKIIQEACEILTPMTFHVARHTFAKTVSLKNGVPLETVQMMMGHTKISTTQIYADVDEEKIMYDMSGINDKLDKKREIVLSKLRREQQIIAKTY